jgi:hypothetical protein
LDATITVRFSEKMDFMVIIAAILTVIAHRCTSEVPEWFVV